MRNSRELSRLRTFPLRAPNTEHSSIWCLQARVSGMQSIWCDDCSQSNVRPHTCTGVLSFREWRHVHSKNVVMALNNLETLFCLLFNWYIRATLEVTGRERLTDRQWKAMSQILLKYFPRQSVRWEKYYFLCSTNEEMDPESLSCGRVKVKYFSFSFSVNKISIITYSHFIYISILMQNSLRLFRSSRLASKD